jgi:cytosine/adenosine deaminase-related metal-dependent hydrolase
VLVRAGTVVDAGGVDASPGGLLLEGSTVIAAGELAAIGEVADATVIDRPFSAVVPAFVNAHAHLDLSHVEPIPGGGDFTAWIAAIRAARHPDDASIARSVRRGIELSLAGGTAAIGDIAGTGSPVPTEALRRSPLMGVSYREFFGVGRRQPDAAAAIAALAEADRAARGEPGADASLARIRQGISPHAPYSCGPRVFAAAAAAGLPIATHLAETLEELEFVRDGGGRFEAFLREIEAWDDSVTEGPDAMGATGRHAVDLVLESLAAGVAGAAEAAEAAGDDRPPTLAAHGNYLRPEDHAALAAAGVGIAYCPRASSWFRHPVAGHGPHPWRELLQAGVLVCLGTDGRPCLDTEDRISVLDEMRFLVRRDRVSARTVLPLATVHGARGLGLDPAWFTFAAGHVAGVLALPADASIHGDRLEAAMRVGDAPEWLVDPAWPGA